MGQVHRLVKIMFLMRGLLVFATLCAALRTPAIRACGVISTKPKSPIVASVGLNHSITVAVRDEKFKITNLAQRIVKSQEEEKGTF